MIFMLKNFFIILLCLSLIALIIILAIPSVSGQEKELKSNDEPVLYYFWGYCPICSKPEEHVWLFDDYPIKVEIYEVFHDQKGRQIYDRFRETHGIEVFGFPTLVFEDRYWLGFSNTVQAEILEAIEASLEGREAPAGQNIINLPFVGEINLLASPVLLTTAIIATLDGFNPCSLFVLTFLLAIIIHSASRKRIFLVGITFLLVTSIVYGLFILGILNIMIFVSELFWIRNLVAAVVIILGLVGIKDFFYYKQGISFAIPDSYKSKFYRQVRQIFYTDSPIPTVAATALMALGIALIELPCTAGFPFIWSSIVSGMELPLSYFAFLFFIYILLYLAIELLIFFSAVVRMRSIKLTEERGRFLKLVAGSLMLVLGLILLIKPEYMESVLGIALAFGFSLLLIFLFYFMRTLTTGKKIGGS